MTKCINFYLDFGPPTLLLAVALHSLKKYYNGNIHVVYGTSVPAWFVDIMKQHPQISTQASTHVVSGASGHIHAYNVRPQVHLDMPFDVSIMYDCDHVFVRPVPDSLFDYASQHGLGSYGFNTEQLRRHGQWKTEKTAKAIQSIGLPCPDSLQPSAGSCVCSMRTKEGREMVKFWDDHIKLFVKHPETPLGSKFADQHALSYAMQRYGVPMGDYHYSYSGQLASQADIKPIPEGVIAIHFGHGRFKKREADHVFAQELGEAIQADFMGLSTEIKRYADAHDQYRVYAKRMSVEYEPHKAVFAETLKRC
jgi:hypothetical protein